MTITVTAVGQSNGSVLSVDSEIGIWKAPVTICVTDYGATGDGITDDGPAIQAAIDYAETIVGPGNIENGVSIHLQDGHYLLSTPITISATGIHLIGGEGRGALLFGPGSILQIRGTTSTQNRASGCKNIVFQCTNTSSTSSVGVTLWNTVGADIINCEFYNFWVAMDLYRASSTWVSGCRTSGSLRTVAAEAAMRFQGLDLSETITGASNDRTEGAGARITDCSFYGRDSATLMTRYGFKILATDSIYITQCHFGRYEKSIALMPDATAENHVVTTIQVNGCYFDNPAGDRADARCLLVGGAVDPSIELADGTLVTSMYQNLMFSNCYFRGAAVADYLVEIEVTDDNGWEGVGIVNSFGPMLFTGCVFRRSRKHCVFSPAADSLRPVGLMFNGCAFESYNESGDIASEGGAAMSIRAASFSAVGCWFRNALPDTEHIIIVQPPTATAVILGNDFSLAPSLLNPVEVDRSASQNAVVTAANVAPGLGRQMSRLVKTQTEDDESVTKELYAVTVGEGGYIEVTVTGNKIANITGTTELGRVVVLKFAGGYRRIEDGTLYFQGGADLLPVVTDSEFIGGTFTADLPTISKEAGGVIALNVNGAEDEIWSWVAEVKLVEAT